MLTYSFISSPDTFGVYTCAAENELGFTSAQLKVTPLAADIKISSADLPVWSDAFVFQWSLLSGSAVQELHVQVFGENNETTAMSNGTNLFTNTRHIQKDGSPAQVTYHNENIMYKDYYEITKLNANATYVVRMRVKNEFATEWSDWSKNLTVKTLSDLTQKHKPHQIHHHRHQHGRKIKGFSQQTGSRDLNAKRDRFVNYENNVATSAISFSSVKLCVAFLAILSVFYF